MPDSVHPFRSWAAREAYLAYYDERASRWPVPFEERTVATPLGETFVRVSGPPDAPPMVLLPGDSETSLSWAPLIGRLSKTHRTFALDQIFDYGRSIYTRPLEEPDDFVRWLDEVADALALESFDLAGFSYGSWIASRYALEHPERLGRLVLLAPTSTVVGPSVGLLARAMLYYFVSLKFVTRPYNRWYNAAAIRRSPETRAHVDELIDEAVRSRRAFKRHRFIAPTVLSDDEWRQLMVPALFVVGEEEVTYPAERALERLAAVAPRVRTVLLPDVGHDLLFVEPERVATEMLAFLDAVVIDR